MVYVVIALIVFPLSGLLAMAGVGAAFLFVPIFYWLGVPLATASSTGLLLNAVSLSLASWTYWRAGLVNWRLGIPVTITAVAAAPLGALLAPHADKKLLLGLLAAFLLFAGTMMLTTRGAATPRTLQRRTETGAGAAAGTVAGFLGGLLGVGGGNIILPVLTELGAGAKVAAGTTAVAVVFSSLSGFLGRASTGHLNPVLLAVAATGAAAGSLTGSRLMATKVTTGQLKRLIGVVLLAVAATLIAGLAGA